MFAANRKPCVRILFASSCSRHAEKRRRFYQGSSTEKKVSGAGISLIQIKFTNRFDVISDSERIEFEGMSGGRPGTSPREGSVISQGPRSQVSPAATLLGQKDLWWNSVP